MMRQTKKTAHYANTILTDQKGQAITEYVALVALFVGIALMLVVLLDSFSSYGWRILSLVGMDYP